MAAKVVVSGESSGGQFQPIRARLEAAGCEVLSVPASAPGEPAGWTPALIDQYFREADAFIGMFASRPITKEVLQAGERLRVGASPVIGTEHIDVAAATELGIVIGYGAVPENLEGVAEAVVMLIAGLLKHLPQKWAAVRDGGWRVDDPGRMVRDATVGFIGLGNIGRASARRLAGWDVSILSFDPYVTAETGRELGVEMVGLEELLGRSDVVSIMVLLTDETRHLLGADELRRMKPGAYLINTSRGACVDEEALVEALRSGHLAGAAIDVWEQEPAVADNPLRAMPNVIATGHNVGHSQEVMRTIPDAAVENVLRGLRGEPPLYVRNPEVLPAWRERLRALGVAAPGT
jgi:phosphoglycerate dehydrogenase-like enzyme